MHGGGPGSQGDRITGKTAMNSETPVPDVAFSHVGLFVHDLERMEGFYRRVLGFTVTDRGELPTPAGRADLVFLSRDPREHHQLVLATGRPPEVGFNVVNQISFRVPDLAALRRFHSVLTGEGVGAVAPVTHGNAISLYFPDPEGTRIELFFDTPWYCTQPVREPVDLARSDADILAETERLARSRPGFATREAWMAELAGRMGAPPGG